MLPCGGRLAFPSALAAATRRRTEPTRDTTTAPTRRIDTISHESPFPTHSRATLVRVRVVLSARSSFPLARSIEITIRFVSTRARRRARSLARDRPHRASDARSRDRTRRDAPDMFALAR